MNLLAFDTSTDLLTIALGEKAENYCEIKATISSIGKRQHGQMLAPTVASLLEQVDWDASNIDGLVVGIGPGSYTGLRIGATFAKVWANSKKLPLFTVSSLALMAAATLELAGSGEAVIMPIMDARRNSAYTGLYRWIDGQVVAEIEDCHTDFQAWLDQLKQVIQAKQTIIIVGNDIDAFVEQVKVKFAGHKVHTITDWRAYPHANRALNQVQLSKVADLDILAPNYGHATLAEQEWEQKAEAAGEDIQKYKDVSNLIDHH